MAREESFEVGGVLGGRREEKRSGLRVEVEKDGVRGGIKRRRRTACVVDRPLHSAALPYAVLCRVAADGPVPVKIPKWNPLIIG